MSALCQKDVGRWQPNLTSSGRGRRPHSRRILDDRASLRLYHCPIVRADNLRNFCGEIPIMQNPLIIGCIVFLILLAGAFASWTIRQRLPEHHLTDDTKSLVSVSMAVVATVSALVLGLLISNANTSFRSLGGDVTTLSAQILRTRQHTAPIRARHISSSGDAATVRRSEDCRSVSRRRDRRSPRQPVDIRTAPAARRFDA